MILHACVTRMILHASRSALDCAMRKGRGGRAACALAGLVFLMFCSLSRAATAACAPVATECGHSCLMERLDHIMDIHKYSSENV